MELITISEASKQFNITTRTLRYYEQIGLLKSSKLVNYAYRAYDDDAILKLKQIMLLRKLDIALKDIGKILKSDDKVLAIKTFQNKISDIESAIESMSIIKSAISILITKLNQDSILKLSYEMFKDDKVIEILNTTSSGKTSKEQHIMNNLNKANKNLSKLNGVRIVYLPPSTVASSHYIGKDPEQNAQKQIVEFAKENNLCDIKPDLRVYGFNNPNPDENNNYGYEFWITIPDDTEVKKPLQKKHFEGGLYAAYCIKMGDFHKWSLFAKWVETNKTYDYERRNPLSMNGTLEEHINAYSFLKKLNPDNKFVQLDLLIPIKKRD